MPARYYPRMRGTRLVTVSLGLLAVVLMSAACGNSNQSAQQSPTSTPPGTSMAPTLEAVAFGTKVDIASSDGTAAYTIDNLQPVPPDAQIVPAKGTMYAVDVTIVAKSGTPTYNGFYLVARAADGRTSLPPSVLSGPASPQASSRRISRSPATWPTTLRRARPSPRSSSATRKAKCLRSGDRGRFGSGGASCDGDRTIGDRDAGRGGRCSDRIRTGGLSRHGTGDHRRPAVPGLRRRDQLGRRQHRCAVVILPGGRRPQSGQLARESTSATTVYVDLSCPHRESPVGIGVGIGF